MFCPKCGKKVWDDSQFCYACGTRIVIPNENEVATDNVPLSKKHPVENKWLGEEEESFEIREETMPESPVKKKKGTKKKSGCAIVLLVAIILVALFIAVLIMRFLKINNSTKSNTHAIIGIESFNAANEIGSKIDNSYTKSNSNNAGNSKSSHSITCSMCGKSWEPGDAGGNYMSIAMTSMCKSCYNNFKQMEVYRDALGK